MSLNRVSIFSLGADGALGNSFGVFFREKENKRSFHGCYFVWIVIWRDGSGGLSLHLSPGVKQKNTVRNISRPAPKTLKREFKGDKYSLKAPDVSPRREKL